MFRLKIIFVILNNTMFNIFVNIFSRCEIVKLFYIKAATTNITQVPTVKESMLYIAMCFVVQV